LQWQAVSGASKYYIYRGGVKIGTSTTTTFKDNNVPNGVYPYKVSAVYPATNVEGAFSNTVNVTVVQTPPVLGAITFSANPAFKDQNVGLSVNVTGNLYGFVGGEYYIGGTDPGHGNGMPMTFADNSLSASLSGLSEGTYNINVRAQNSVGWSQPVTAMLTVVKPVFTGTVKDSNNTVLTGVSVYLHNSSGTAGSSITASDGSFSIPVNPGVYALRVTGTNSTVSELGSFTLSQPASTPTIDLTASHVNQNVVLPVASVEFTIYNAQGYPYSNSGRVYATSTTSSVSLYPGAPNATLSGILASPIAPYVGANSQGKGTFKSLVGTTYSGADSNNRICMYTQVSVLIDCRTATFAVSSVTDQVDVPKSPSATNSFSGTLTNSSSTALSGVAVSLRDAYGNVVTANTNSSGNFTVAVQPGVYSLRLSGGNSTNVDVGLFSLAQPSTTPTIDLMSSNVSQDLTIPVATVDWLIYDDQGNLGNNTGLYAWSTLSSQGSDVVLYPGGPTATESTVQAGLISGPHGTGTFKSIVGIRYSAVNSNSDFCGYINNQYIGCSGTPFTVTSGSNAIEIHETP